MDIDLIKRSIRLDRQRLQDTSSDLLIQKNIGKTAVIGRSRAIKERINKKIMELEEELVTLTKKWFIDRDLEHGGRLDKQALKLSEEFGELCAGYLKQNEKLTKFVTDSYFEDLYDAVMPFGNIRDLKRIIDHIIEVEDNHE